MHLFNPTSINGLVNYWPMSNSYKDIVGGNDIIEQTNSTLPMDRFNNPKSALGLNFSYVKASPGVYFSGDFTITAWVKMYQIVDNLRVLDFGNGPFMDNVVFGFFRAGSFFLFIINGQSDIYVRLTSVSTVTINKWDHIAVTLNGNFSKIYLNGVLDNSIANMHIPKNLIRNNAYMGRSNWGGDSLVYGDFDEIKIYNRCLSDKEIADDFNYSHEIYLN